MTVATVGPVRLDFNDYVIYTETHPEDAFELIDGAIYRLAPEGDPHARTRSAIQMYLSSTLDLERFTPYTEMSFRAPDWSDGPKPDNFVARGPWMLNGQIAERPVSRDIALVIEVSSTSRPKDRRRAELYARLAIPEYWLIDLRAVEVVRYLGPTHGVYETSQTFLRGQILESTSAPGLQLPVDFLLQLATK